jgi:hypothetical protein
MPILVKVELVRPGGVRLTFRCDDGSTAETTLYIGLTGWHFERIQTLGWPGLSRGSLKLDLDLFQPRGAATISRPPEPACWCGPDPREVA